MMFSNNNFSNECGVYWTEKLKIQGVAIAPIARGLGIRSQIF